MAAPLAARCLLCGTGSRFISSPLMSSRGLKTNSGNKNAFIQYLQKLKWVPIPLGVGFAYIGYQQYGHIKERENRKIQNASSPEELVASDWQIMAYKAFPLRFMSSLWGKINGLELPTFLRSPLLRLYIWAFDCQLDEAAVRDLKHYRNLGEFFRRALKQGVRPVDEMHILTSPCDGKILHFGKSERGLVEQVKGVTYPVQGFLGPQSWPTETIHLPQVKENEPEREKTGTLVTSHGNMMDAYLFANPTYERKLKQKDANDIYHCVIYLAPGDYHRFHSPTEWSMAFRRHFPGELFSVSPFIAGWIKGLFSMNERAVYVGEWKHGFFSMAAVGATNVGSIKVYCDQALITNNRKRKFPKGTYCDAVFFDSNSSGIPFRKGEIFGEFNLGSTIVLVFEAPKNFKFTVEGNQKIKMGQPLGNCDDALSATGDRKRA